MADLPTVEQAGSATVWFTTQAGITATVLAVGCIILLTALIWSMRHCRKELRDQASEHAVHVKHLTEEWGKRIDQFRADVKEAFGQNDGIADKVVEAMNNLKLEIARMSGRSERG